MSKFTVEQQLASLEHKVNRFRLLCLIQLILLCAVAVSAVVISRVEAQNSEQILRARGLVIEDAQGRARVILGAPFPAVRERKRQDSTTQAMIFLDENGNDRLTLGEGPDPQVDGKALHRIARHYGVLIHDNKGDERGAYGYLANGRVVVTLDRPGAEAWAAIVNDKTGLAQMSLLYPPDAGSGGNAFEMGTQGSNAFLRLKDTKDTNRSVLQIGADGVPALQIFDSAGRPVRNLLQSESAK